MDFMERITESINETPGLANKIKIGYLGAEESFVIYPLPGSNVTSEYMDGTTDQSLNFEIAMKSKSTRLIHETLWIVQNKLEHLTDLISKDNSFEFNEVRITSKPFINEADEQGWLVFLLEIKALITVNK